MADFTLSFKMDNAAFAATTEVGRILRQVAKSAEGGANHGPIVDSNGNRVGEWDIIAENEHRLAPCYRCGGEVTTVNGYTGCEVCGEEQ